MGDKKNPAVSVIALAMLLFAFVAIADEGERDQEKIGDVDPTKPVLFNIRNEFYKLTGDDWRNVFILRADIIRLSELKSLLLRFDVPFIAADLGGVSKTGLGDIYGQALFIPYRAKSFFFAAGSGLTVPSATEDILGTGKWLISPIAIPGWWFKEPRTLIFIKFQDYISFAGQDDRADVHYLTIDPFLAMKLSDRWWFGCDTEVKVNWTQNNQRSFKSGITILRMWTRGFGTWIKPEIPWGANREGEWTVKASFFWNY